MLQWALFNLRISPMRAKRLFLYLLHTHINDFFPSYTDQSLLNAIGKGHGVICKNGKKKKYTLAHWVGRVKGKEK